VTVDRADGRWLGPVGLVTTLMEDAVADPAGTTAFVCGPEIMMQRSAEALVNLGMAATDIRVSLERNMRCGTGEIETCYPAHGVQRAVERPAQRLGQRDELGPGRDPVEAAEADVDRVDGPAADHLHDGVPGLLQGQAALDEVAPGRGHLDPAGVAEEIGRVQQVDVQRVALDPLPAVQQPAQVGERPADGHAAGVLDRGARGQLVGRRADTADPGGDVRGLGVGPAAQERLEEAGRLVDVQPRVSDRAAVRLDVQGALALDPGQFPDR